MKCKLSVYQTKEYEKSLEISGEKIISLSDKFFAVERIIKTPLGIKKIIEARGTPRRDDLIKFKEKCKDYFYGTIMPVVVNENRKIFEEENFRRVVNYTILIDLSKEKEDLRKNLEKKSIRWGVGKAEKEDLRFSVIKNNEELDNFYRLYELTARNGGFKPESKKFIGPLIKSETAKLFVVKKNEKVLAGGLMLIDRANNYSILDLTSASDEGLRLQAMPFLYWNLMIYSKERGLGYFDLGGYDKEAKEGDKTHNINRFKERFGGNIVDQPIYSSNWKYPFFRGLMKKMRILKRLYKK